MGDQFPKVLYVHKDADGDDVFFIATEELASHAEVNNSIPIGRYVLDRESFVTAWANEENGAEVVSKSQRRRLRA